MTTITETEIKLIVIQIILMAILTTMMGLYAASVPQTTTIPTTASAITTDASTSGGSWILGLIYVPEGMDTMFLISALVMAPFLLLDIPIALRFAKDLATQWV